MKQSVSLYDFKNAFQTSSCRKEQFSYEALKGIYEYLTDLEEDTGVEIEFDMIAICCDFVEVSLTDLEELENYKESQEVWRGADSVVYSN